MGLARLLILAEERLLGRGLASLLESRFETHSIESFERANRLLGSDRVEIALWLGDRIDADTARQITALKTAHPDLRLCLLARTADADALRPLFLEDGFGVAVLLRSGELDVGQVMASLEQVLAGRATVEPSILKRLVARPDADGILARLTPDEREVLALVAQGLRNRAIARRVWKSEKAVEKQVGHVFAKLGLGHETVPDLDRRVAAARIFFECRPDAVVTNGAGGIPPQTEGDMPCRGAQAPFTTVA
jgi:DNA-binding NarL/FixJ family response regulator